MRVLGVDPGTVVAGYGILEAEGGGGGVRALAYGVIRARRAGAERMERRLWRVFRGLGQLIEEHAPQALALEQAFVYKNARSALMLGHGRAAAMLAAAAHGLPVYEYQPALVKKAVTGSGRAGKAQVQEMVRRLLGLGVRPALADAADALAVALCHLHRGERPAAPSGG
ncbi:MAG: crossover junction endodeoxyribonuclease RuvC [Planctomycetota bacterium]|nr:MAG: crossover junction endodeoxyribonuclease RuvC [Planctomycetota bacterium]